MNKTFPRPLPPALQEIVDVKAKLATPVDGPGKYEAIVQPVIPNDLSIQDSGMAVIIDCGRVDDENAGMFVRLHSWSESKEHDQIRKFIGKRIRITVETID